MDSRHVLVERNILGTTLTVEAQGLGKDISLLVSGGVPHIGCCILTLPRPSLLKDRSGSCTSSVLNVLGHKDDVICKLIAEEVCVRTGHRVACVGGFHLDDIRPEEIQMVVDAAHSIASKLVELL